MSDRNISGYEKATLFELRIARLAAWLLWLLAALLPVAYVLNLNFLDVTWFEVALAELALNYAAYQSARCENDAEEKLKAIWEANGLHRMVSE